MVDYRLAQDEGEQAGDVGHIVRAALNVRLSEPVGSGSPGLLAHLAVLLVQGFQLDPASRYVQPIARLLFRCGVNGKVEAFDQQLPQHGADRIEVRPWLVIRHSSFDIIKGFERRAITALYVFPCDVPRHRDQIEQGSTGNAEVRAARR